ncbi:uncharacterized protein [Antedon mediterranea]|uniref:uncharacterized protein n=1 Tax=Antedon mediterranea TaxID=105859 RepID=UPI003AF7BF55
MSCCHVSCEDLGLSTKENDTFTKGQCPFCCNRLTYVIYRIVVAFSYIVFLILYLVRFMQEIGFRLFIYVTSWSVIVFSIYNVIAMLNSIIFTRSNTEEEDSSKENAMTRDRAISSNGPGTIGRQVNERIFNQSNAFQRMVVKRRIQYKMSTNKKTQWLLFNISCNTSFIISTVYWTSVYVLNLYDKPNTSFDFVDIIHITVIPSVLSLIELVLFATPVHFVHFHYTWWFGLLYVFFNVVYWLTGGTNEHGEHYIYDLTDYDEDFLTAIISVLCLLIAVVISQASMWTIYCLRMLVSHQKPIVCQDNTESVEINVPIYENLGFESPYATVM